MFLIDTPVRTELEREALVEINALRRRHGMEPLRRLRPGQRETGMYDDCILGANLDHRTILAGLASAEIPVLRRLEERFENGELPHLEVASF